VLANEPDNHILDWSLAGQLTRGNTIRFSTCTVAKRKLSCDNITAYSMQCCRHDRVLTYLKNITTQSSETGRDMNTTIPLHFRSSSLKIHIDLAMKMGRRNENYTNDLG